MNELPKPPKLPGGRRHDEVFNPKKLFVGGLSKETTQQQFRAYWEQWGELQDCVVMIDPKTQKSRGFGFVVFASQQIASDILSRSESLTMYGRKLDIKKAVPRSNHIKYRETSSQGHSPLIPGAHSHSYSHSHCHSDAVHNMYDRAPHPPYYPPHPMYPPPQHAHNPRSRPYPPYPITPHHRVASLPRDYRSYDRHSDTHFRRTTNRKREDKLFVGGLADTFTERTLRSYFNKYGKVHDAVVMFDADGNSRRFGFVTFVNPDNSDLVLNDGKHTINGVNVTVERAIPKNKLGGAHATSPRRERRQSPIRAPDYDPYPYRYDDPYYRYPPTHAPPIYGHKGPPPPPIYSPPPTTHYAHHPPPISPHVLPRDAAYPPPHYPRAPAYYYPPSTAASIVAKAGSVAKPVSNTNAPVRYQYTYPPAPAQADPTKQSVSEMKTSLSVKMEEKKRLTANQMINRAQESGINAVPNTKVMPVAMDNRLYYAQNAYAAAIHKPPVHAPSPYGAYRATYPNTPYGGSRGGVAATKAYHPY